MTNHHAEYPAQGYRGAALGLDIMLVSSVCQLLIFSAFTQPDLPWLVSYNLVRILDLIRGKNMERRKVS